MKAILAGRRRMPVPAMPSIHDRTSASRRQPAYSLVSVSLDSSIGSRHAPPGQHALRTHRRGAFKRQSEFRTRNRHVVQCNSPTAAAEVLLGCACLLMVSCSTAPTRTAPWCAPRSSPCSGELRQPRLVAGPTPTLRPAYPPVSRLRCFRQIGYFRLTAPQSSLNAHRTTHCASLAWAWTLLPSSATVPSSSSPISRAIFSTSTNRPSISVKIAGGTGWSRVLVAGDEAERQPSHRSRVPARGWRTPRPQPLQQDRKRADHARVVRLAGMRSSSKFPHKIVDHVRSFMTLGSASLCCALHHHAPSFWVEQPLSSSWLNCLEPEVCGVTPAAERRLQKFFL
jgi:hypothetical protein